VACASPHFDVDEGIRFEDGTARLVAFSQKKTGWVLRGVSDVEVRFFVDGQEVARSVTDERGFAKAVTRVPASEKFAATASFSNESFRADGRLVAWRSDRVIVGCDIDSTISQTDLRALFFGELDLSTPIEGSADALNDLDRDFQILYVTARPRFTLPKTTRWLTEHGYPREPVVTSLTVRDALRQTGYKTRTLDSLRKHYQNLLIGIGNTAIDADSYSAHGMLALLVQPDREPGREGNVFHFQNWEQVAAFFRHNAEVLRDPARLRAALAGGEPLLLPDAS